MKCPHCLTDFHDSEVQGGLGNDIEGAWAIGQKKCSACGRFIFQLAVGRQWAVTHRQLIGESRSFMVWPKVAARSPVPKEVPPEFSEDYLEACLVIADSPKASAALSRRCLQFLLRERGGTKSKDLAEQIQEVIDGRMLPSHISDGLDAVRTIGNFAAHAIKSKSSGEIVPVEPGEAEWNLDVLEALFDFYFVAPARTLAKREALNKKLADAGKPQLK